MAGRYKAYPEYKNSGVEWLDNLPSHWETVALKMLIDVRDGTHDTPAYVEPSESSYPLVTSKDVTGGEINLTICKQISEEDYNSIIKRSAVSIGDILMPMIGTVGSPILIESNSNIAIKNLALFKTSAESNQLDTKYLLYFLNSNECSLQFSLESRGGVQNFVSLGTLRNLGLPFVPPSEQQKIANFLDHETAKIDTLIAKQEKLIELLKEKRQAVISHAVTKGLNSDVPMKDSGVEWLGEVPEGWDVLRINLLFNESNQRAFFKEELEYPVLSVSIHNGISDKEMTEGELERKVQRSEDRSLYKVVRSNYLAYNMMRAWQGGFGAATLDGLVSPAYVVCQPKTDLDSYFFELALRTPNAVTELKKYSRGITDFRLRLYWDEFKNICVPVPPKDEIKLIMQEINLINTKYEKLEHLAKQQIELLTERRTALISAAVTGKIDVRHFVAEQGQPQGVQG